MLTYAFSHTYKVNDFFLPSQNPPCFKNIFYHLIICKPNKSALSDIYKALN